MNNKAAIAELLATGQGSPSQLREIWQLRGMRSIVEDASTAGAARASAGAWLEDASVAALFVRRALEIGEYFLACDAAREALGLHGPSTPVEIHVALAAALARLGALDESRKALPGIGDTALNPSQRAEVHSISAGILLDEADASSQPEERLSLLREAHAENRRAADMLPSDCSSNLLAAASALALGPTHDSDARLLLERASKAIPRTANIDEPNGDILLAHGELLLLSGELEAAREILARAARLAPAHRVAAVRRRARLAALAGSLDVAPVESCFPPLNLIVFSGHPPDLPDRALPRFPSTEEEHVRALLRHKLEELDARIGIVSAAAGADLIFAEEMLERGAELHIVLPWLRDSFAETSVAIFGSEWVERFERALARAASVRVLGEFDMPSTAVGLDYTNRVMSGLARLMARALGLGLVPLAVWDGLPGAPGGTAHFVGLWDDKLVPTQIVPLRQLQPSPITRHPTLSPSPPENPGFRQEIKTLLFADIVGYSKLPESRVPLFVREFMGLVSDQVSRSPNGPISIDTWGDAIYCVFDRAEDAGLFALDLHRAIAVTDWEERGLFWEERVEGSIRRRPLSLRSGLHTGPVFLHFNPVARRLGFTGAHVSRAARIEPITEPGCVFASEAFAALAALEGTQRFSCELVGSMSLAKKYPGEHRIYRLTRRLSLPLDRLARAIHDDYCLRARERGETPELNSSLRPWDQLSAELQASNREQAAEIQAALRKIGFALDPTCSAEAAALSLSPTQVELLARAEHERWCDSKRRAGWTHGRVRDETRKFHPSLVAWDQLADSEKNRDRTAALLIPELVALAGMGVVRAGKD